MVDLTKNASNCGPPPATVSAARDHKDNPEVHRTCVINADAAEYLMQQIRARGEK